MKKLNPIRQRVWKVVHVARSGRLMSCVFEFLDSKYVLEYVRGKLVRPKIGKIFAFVSLDSAKAFLVSQGSDDHELWEAEAYGCESLYYRTQTNGSFDTNIVYFWHKVSQAASQGKDLTPLREWFTCPFGTVGCRALRLIKKL
jgi:hypothetical protein